MAYLPRLFAHLVFLFLAVAACGATAIAAEITALRSWRAPDNTRLVLDLSGPVRYHLSPDSTPARLVVEIADAHTAGPLALPPVQAPLTALRLEPSGKAQRLIIDTALEVQPKIFQLAPNEKYGHRLVLDLYDKLPAGQALAGARPAEKQAAAQAAAARGSDDIAVARPLPDSATTPVPLLKPGQREPEKFDPSRYRNLVVAIDAGHGGEDPGAIGQKGTYEKHVTLAIARELHRRLKAEPGITPVLVRDGDYFIPLQERRRLARFQHKADIFISIHADSAENRRAHGASVFALSLKGAGTATSRFARMLAERENKADLIGGVALENEDDTLRSVLADMVVAGSLEHSLHMGRNILQGLERIGSLHSRQVEQAGFAVLKEPGMLSLLVETGFISNADEEQKLISRQYQEQIAEAIVNGVRQYCQSYPTPSTYFAWLAEQNRAESPARARPATEQAPGARPPAPVLVSARASAPATVPRPAFIRHKVVRGDNLTRLAARYQVSLEALREANNLRNDNVMLGQVLKIPAN